jgi:alkanesulfonate monooxygenase SsuD/methylene tetrahydromethanopterin reductase-like flavin-dependent oxidoreductase (luciferase family)
MIPLSVLDVSLITEGADVSRALGNTLDLAQHAEPYVMLGLNVFAADTDDEAQYLMSSAQQSLLNLRNGHPARLPAPFEDFEAGVTEAERTMLRQTLRCSGVVAPSWRFAAQKRQATATPALGQRIY